MEKAKLMKSEATRAISLVGGATMVALAVGFGGLWGNTPSNATTATSSNATAPTLAVHGGSTDRRVSAAPTGCIVGLNCGCIPHRTCR